MGVSQPQTQRKRESRTLSKTTNIKRILPAFLLLCLIACSDETDEAQTQSILGSWQWVGSSGGIAGQTETPESTGSSRRLDISSTTIRTYRNGVLTATVDYFISTQESQLYNEPREMVVQENGFRSIIAWEGDQLVLIGDCADCFTETYRR